MQWLIGLLQSLQNIIPIDRWLQAVGNLLRGLNLAFILFFIALLALILNDLGFAPRERLALISLFVAIDGVIILIEVALAVRGDWLYSPKERSLQRGQQYGTERLPRKRRKALRLPKEAQGPALPPRAKRR